MTAKPLPPHESNSQAFAMPALMRPRIVTAVLRQPTKFMVPALLMMALGIALAVIGMRLVFEAGKLLADRFFDFAAGQDPYADPLFLLLAGGLWSLAGLVCASALLAMLSSIVAFHLHRIFDLPHRLRTLLYQGWRATWRVAPSLFVMAVPTILLFAVGWIADEPRQVSSWVVAGGFVALVYLPGAARLYAITVYATVLGASATQKELRVAAGITYGAWVPAIVSSRDRLRLLLVGAHVAVFVATLQVTTANLADWAMYQTMRDPWFDVADASAMHRYVGLAALSPCLVLALTVTAHLASDAFGLLRTHLGKTRFAKAVEKSDVPV